MKKLDLREISLLLKQAQQRKQIAVDAALSGLDCSLAQWVVLRRIWAYPGESSHFLAMAAFQTDQAFGLMTRRLIERGLVVRQPGRGRVINHSLTAQGQKLLDACEPIVRDTLKVQFSSLNEDELQILGSLLGRIID